jgi:hypothetical protein
VKLVPVAIELPPVEAAYQVAVPVVQVAPKVTVPVPQIVAGVTVGGFALEFIPAITVVRGEDSQPTVDLQVT